MGTYNSSGALPPALMTDKPYPKNGIWMRASGSASGLQVSYALALPWASAALPQFRRGETAPAITEPVSWLDAFLVAVKSTVTRSDFS